MLEAIIVTYIYGESLKDLNCSQMQHLTYLVYGISIFRIAS